jgi:hypothetical protein
MIRFSPGSLTDEVLPQESVSLPADRVSDCPTMSSVVHRQQS